MLSFSDHDINSPRSYDELRDCFLTLILAAPGSVRSGTEMQHCERVCSVFVYLQ